MSSFIVPASALEGRTAPDWFKQRLKSIDPCLFVYWNPIRCRWTIDRYTCGMSSLHEHGNHCPRTNVKVVQDQQGEYMPLCEQIIEWLQGHDVGSQFDSAEDYVRHLRAIGDANDAKIKKDMRENTRHATLSNKRQLLQAHTLIQRHDMRPNEKERIKKFEAAERRKGLIVN
jgi:hypothetical protein